MVVSQQSLQWLQQGPTVMSVTSLWGLTAAAHPMMSLGLLHICCLQRWFASLHLVVRRHKQCSIMVPYSVQDDVTVLMPESLLRWEGILLWGAVLQTSKQHSHLLVQISGFGEQGSWPDVAGHSRALSVWAQPTENKDEMGSWCCFHSLRYTTLNLIGQLQLCQFQ